MSTEIAQILPGDKIGIVTDTWTEKFWTAARERRLVACKCADCGTFRLPPWPYCPNCQSQKAEWPELNGTGTVFSFVICKRPNATEQGDMSYIAAVIDLDGAPGARIVSNVVDLPVDEVFIGMKVTVDYNPIKDGWLLPIFRRLAA